jgi:hypothetical protein
MTLVKTLRPVRLGPGKKNTTATQFLRSYSAPTTTGNTRTPAARSQFPADVYFTQPIGPRRCGLCSGRSSLACRPKWFRRMVSSHRTGDCLVFSAARKPAQPAHHLLGNSTHRQSSPLRSSVLPEQTHIPADHGMSHLDTAANAYLRWYLSLDPMQCGCERISI